MSKKIVVLNGSPRKNGNTAMLIDSFTKGAENVGNQVTRFDLQQMNLHPCIGCGAGGKDKTSPCIQKDDMDRIYQALYEAEVLVLATPVYGWGMSAQLKMVLDRMAAILEAGIPNTKETYLLTAAGDNSEENFAPLVLHYETMAKYLNWTDKGRILAGGFADIGDIVGNPILEEAQKLGESVC